MYGTLAHSRAALVHTPVNALKLKPVKSKDDATSESICQRPLLKLAVEQLIEKALDNADHYLVKKPPCILITDPSPK